MRKYFPHIVYVAFLAISLWLMSDYWKTYAIAGIILGTTTAVATDPIVIIGALLLGTTTGAVNGKHRWLVFACLLFAIPMHYFVAFTNGIDLGSRSFFLLETTQRGSYWIEGHGVTMLSRFLVILLIADIANAIALLAKSRVKRSV